MQSVISLKESIKVLDHGYVRYIEHLGYGDAGVDEAGIIEAARQSTQGSFRGWETDEKLLAYLFNSDHSTPFEFCELVIEVQAPIFVFREWHRHRSQSFNEMSARYAPLPDLNYLPTIERCHLTSPKNKQAGTVKGADDLTNEFAKSWLERQEILYKLIEQHYQDGLQNGIPKEIARIGLPVGRYSRMRAKANLRNWLAFITLRSDPNAQQEIQVYSRAIEQIVSQCFPRTYNLFLQRRNANG